jgi:hypothetical protein
MDDGAQFGDEADSSGARPEPADLMEPSWCGLSWTLWAALERQAIRETAVAQPGVYRIRRRGDHHGPLTYIGQTGRRLRERLQELAGGVNGTDAPFNDPHTAAPHLWLLLRLDGAAFEFSCAALPADVPILRGTEDMLLWRHRLETGLSTEANYGRFYPGYARPTNRPAAQNGSGGARQTRALQPLAAEFAGPDFGLVTPPLQGDGGILDAAWWQHASLRQPHSVPKQPGVYCIYDRQTREPVYVGETTNLRARSASHMTTRWALVDPWIAVLPVAPETPKYTLHELESDLLGWNFSVTGRAPRFQYRATPSGDVAA